MLNQTFDPFVIELIKGNEALKQAYESLLLQELKLRELSAKSNFNNLKIQISKGKEVKEKPKLAPEIF